MARGQPPIIRQPSVNCYKAEEVGHAATVSYRDLAWQQRVENDIVLQP